MKNENKEAMFDFSKYNLRLPSAIACLLLCLCVSSCGEHVENLPKTVQQQIPKDENSKRLEQELQEQIHKEETEDSIPPDTSPSSPQCPTHADASQSIQGCKNLLDEAQRILHDVRVAKSEQRTQVLQAQLPSWQKKEEDWKVKNNALIAGCGYLLSAHGILVFPEIPSALKNLDAGSTWLEKSMESAAQGHLNTSNAYIRDARKSVNRARKVLDGKDKSKRRKALEGIPDSIKAADERERRADSRP